MEDADFSDDFCRFVQASVPSVEAAELLVAARRDRGQALEPGKHAEGLRAAGLLDEALRYRPASQALGAHVEMLVQAWEERPVTLIRLIYALRDGKIRSFADAFKLRNS
jgi:hypothetical protein